MDLAAEEGLGYGTRLTAALLGDLLYEQGHLAEADRLLDRSHTLGAEGGTVDFMLATYGTGARLKYLLGQNDAAKSRLDEGARLAQQLRLPRLAARIDNERVRAGIGKSASRTPDLDRESRHHRSRDNGIAVLTSEMAEDSAIREALASHPHVQDLGPVYDRAHALVESIDRRARPRAFLNAALLQVETLAAAGREDTARAELLPLAEQCARLGLIRPLLDAGPAVSRLARRLRTHLQDSAGTVVSPELDEYLADLGKQPT
jgi:serine/threonine-protein kinase/serine/threonine-protein kinase PknK